MFLWIVLAALAILLAVILVRAIRFKPVEEKATEPGSVDFDRDSAIKALAELIRCKTVSSENHEEEDDGEFEKLINLLPALYPNVFKVCSFMRLPDRGLLFKWKGRGDGAPAVLMAHYDVVPVEEENWVKPAFEGLIEDGCLWGRGSLDTKITFNGILSAAENLISGGFTPEDDIYFAFSGGEEVNGMGAVHIVDWFEEQGITPSMVVDEGGAVVGGIFPGVSEPCGLIGIAEKGLLNLEYSVTSDGGHASAPAPHTPVGTLAAACARVESHPFKCHFTKPVLAMFDTLGRRSTFLYRVLFSNLWLFKGVLDKVCQKQGGDLNALVRTTVAFTQMNGSLAPNVIPPSASMVSNIRLNPEDTVESAIEYIRGVIGDDSVVLSNLHSMEPSPISDTECEGWNRVCSAVRDTWGCIVSPYLMVQCSDSRHYARISDKVYRFSAMDLTAEERHTIHGNNEHVRLETVERSVEFFIRLMLQC